MRFSFKDRVTQEELILPVTPASFELSHGVKMETINIHTLGDVNLAGYGIMPSFKVNCMFPAKYYSFNQSETLTPPYDYIWKLEAWCDKHSVLDWTIDTLIVPVLIESITYGEKDGTRDVYATISMRKYRQLYAVKTDSNNTGNSSRTDESTSTTTAKTYTVVSGDTLSAIARKFYGDASLYSKLAKYNNIKNANLIYVSQIINLPDKSLL